MFPIRTIISRAAAVAAAAMLLTACKEPASTPGEPSSAPGAGSGASAEGKPIELEFWHYFTGEHDKTLKELTDEQDGVKHLL